MKSNLVRALCAVVFVCASASVLAMPKKTVKVAKEVVPVVRIVSTEELYYYDPTGLRVPLPLSTKVMLRFLDIVKPEAEKLPYLTQFGAMEYTPASALYTGADFLATYPSVTDTPSMVAHIKKMTDDTSIDVTPVFMHEGIPAVVDGIYIETVTPLSQEAVRIGIARFFGTDAMVHEITPVVDERGVGLWHVSFRRLFFLGDKKFPIHILSMANVLQHVDKKPVWVKRTYPKFAYLRDPVVATINVSPKSGTVGEPRTVELLVQISGKEGDVVVDEKDIPIFHHDKKFGILSRGKPPLGGFFDHGNPPPKRMAKQQTSPNTWEISHRYYFNVYAPELDWIIEGVEVPYLYRGKKMTAKVETTTFFVRPHLDDKYKLSDFPDAYVFAVGQNPDLLPATTPSPTHWYTPFAGYVGGVTNVLYGFAGIAALSFCGFLLAVALASYRKLRTWGAKDNAAPTLSMAKVEEELRVAMEHADAIDVLTSMHAVLSGVLHRRFPEITENNSTYQQWKAVLRDEKYRAIEVTLATLDADVVEELFEELEKRNDHVYGSQEPQLLKKHHAYVAELIRAVVETLREQKEEDNGNWHPYPIAH